ncbi:MAG: DNA topoisomerase 4 subunit A, partial [Dehalococcoidia bacterium]|nr:DNA topoisomerase 4 subunit A [Dehalococcoidia bacterium]
MVLGKTKPVNIEDEMRSSYLDYAMSVIVSRALPDVRDGLKPVQRRILYAMDGLGLSHTSSHKKSARIVGEVLGKFHPHGDAPVYEAMVRMAQDFSMRYVLVDGQGNFGSMDNDPPAAMRYTEARLAQIAEQMLVDIDKETVNFMPNFDDSLQEPLVLPTQVPNLLVNGSAGIAVGMATNIPPHNLGEVCDAISYLIDNPEATVDELTQFIKGPDFPTAGIILGGEGIKNAYTTGHGKVVLQAKAQVGDIRGVGRRQIVVTELPYQTNKAALVERIAELVKDRKIEGVSGLRDESDRQGMRIVIELKREAQPKQVLNNLYKYTSMQSAFFVNMLALVDGQPRVISLKEALQYYIDFRHEVITRRSRFELKQAKARAHILEGLKIALDHISRVIATIKKSETAEVARRNLMTGFGLSQAQAQAILDMQLRRLANLERRKILDEYAEVVKNIAYLEDLLANPRKILFLIKEEVSASKSKYGDPRRTEISEEGVTEFREEDLVPHQSVVVTL